MKTPCFYIQAQPLRKNLIIPTYTGQTNFFVAFLF